MIRWNFPGFRKGRAPRKLVEKKFGTQIKDEVKQSVVSDSYQKTLEEHKLSPVSNLNSVKLSWK
ncbi:MAG: trigger factor family protein [Planctomycetia bacterium]|nr:trigger factor family protein [Planctomycetia bacterium]